MLPLAFSLSDSDKHLVVEVVGLAALGCLGAWRASKSDQKTAENTHIIKAVYTLQNSVFGAAKRAAATALRSLAAITKEPGDISRAEAAELDAADHDARQAQVDLEIARRAATTQAKADIAGGARATPQSIQQAQIATTAADAASKIVATAADAAAKLAATATAKAAESPPETIK